MAEAKTGIGVLAGLPRGAGVAVIRLRSLGDTVLTTPALEALKAWRVDLRVAVLVETRFAAALEDNPDISELIPVGATLGARMTALQRLRRFGPALAVGLHGGSTAAWMARLSGAPERATFLGLRHGWAYNRLTPPKLPPPGRAKLHTAEHIASLFEALGMPAVTLGAARLFPTAAARTRMRERLRQAGVSGPFVFVNLDAREPSMRWPRERFVELAAWLGERHGWPSVAASADPGASGLPGIPLIAGTSVADLIALIAESQMAIGNDGGPLHIAAALGRPVIGLYSSTELEIWSPWRVSSECLQRPNLSQIGMDEVEAAVDRLRVSTRP